jgi:hypothetical protein
MNPLTSSERFTIWSVILRLARTIRRAHRRSRRPPRSAGRAGRRRPPVLGDPRWRGTSGATELEFGLQDVVFSPAISGPTRPAGFGPTCPNGSRGETGSVQALRRSLPLWRRQQVGPTLPGQVGPEHGGKDNVEPEGGVGLFFGVAVGRGDTPRGNRLLGVV